MRRLLLAGGLAFALASAAAQSVPPPDDALSPAEVISGLSKQPQAGETPQAAAAKTDPAKKADPPAAKPAAAKTAEAKPATDGLEQCLRDWDAATHMTRQEWARTCRRVAANRSKFQREQLGK